MNEATEDINNPAVTLVDEGGPGGPGGDGPALGGGDYPPPRRRRPRWPYAVLGLMVAAILVTVMAAVNLPYFAHSPGPAIEVEPLITIENADTFPGDGDLYLLTVSRESVNLFGYIEARWFDDEALLVEKEAVIPEGVSQDEQRRIDLGQMESSKDVATAVALEQLGFEIDFTGNGAFVLEVLEGGPSDGVLESGDIIVEFEGEPIEVHDQLIDLIRDRSVGDTVAITVLRGEEEVDVKVTLGERETDDGPVPQIGISTGTDGLEFVFPVEVEIDSQAVVGPSAGMIYTISIMNLLTDEDLTRGHRIAGTGTVALDGSIGAIGGVAQKVHGARAVGAETVLVPEANYPAASEAAGDDIEVIAVGTIDDALSYLEGLDPA